jgi:hypothetical protein
MRFQFPLECCLPLHLHELCRFWDIDALGEGIGFTLSLSYSSTSHGARLPPPLYRSHWLHYKRLILKSLAHVQFLGISSLHIEFIPSSEVDDDHPTLSGMYFHQYQHH